MMSLTYTLAGFAPAAITLSTMSEAVTIPSTKSSFATIRQRSVLLARMLRGLHDGHVEVHRLWLLRSLWSRRALPCPVSLPADRLNVWSDCTDHLNKRLLPKRIENSGMATMMSCECGWTTHHPDGRERPQEARHDARGGRSPWDEGHRRRHDENDEDGVAEGATPFLSFSALLTSGMLPRGAPCPPASAPSRSRPGSP